MNSGAIHFFFEDTSYILPNKKKVREWMRNIIEEENKILDNINVIFCSDNYLLKINKQYLKKDYFTDVIAFSFDESENVICGDIFISKDRAKENSKDVGVRLVDEIHRVVAHGLLHLCGYEDKTKKQKNLMTQKENKYLTSRKF